MKRTKPEDAFQECIYAHQALLSISPQIRLEVTQSSCLWC